MLSPKIKRNISRILPFGIIWLISGLAFLVTDFYVFGHEIFNYHR